MIARDRVIGNKEQLFTDSCAGEGACGPRVYFEINNQDNRHRNHTLKATIWKIYRPRRKLLCMRYVISLGISVFIAFLTGARPSSPDLGTPASIQDRHTVQALYGIPVSEVYKTPENLMVTASFAPNGHLCRAGIRPGKGAEITDKDLNAVLDRLAPKEVRGEFKMGTFLDVTCIKFVKPKNSASGSGKASKPEFEIDPCAECSGVSDDYERATITKYGNTNRYSSVHVTFKQPECEEPEKVHP